MKKLWDSFMGTLRNMSKGKGGGKPIKPAPVVTGYFNGKVNTDVIELDATTKAAVAAATTVTGKLQAVQAALAHPVTVRVFSGATEVGTGTLNSPGFNLSGDFLTPASLQSFSVNQSGTPTPSTWTLRFESGSRWLRGTFGLANSGANFTWSLSTWAAGQVGMIGTVSITAVGANVQPQWSGAPSTLSLYAGQSYNFAQHASDPNGDPLTFTLAAGSGDGYSLTSAGVLTIGSVSKSVTIRASDGVLTADHVCAVTVQTVSGSVWPTQGAITYTPIYPGLRGPATESAGGSGRTYNTVHSPGATVTQCKVYKVNSLADTSTVAALGDNVYEGTLRGCIGHHNTNGGPSVVVFERSGNITLGSQLNITGSNISIYGQTAPSPGIQILGRRFAATGGTDQFIQHLTVRHTAATFYEDASVLNNGGRKVIDHMTIMFGLDENFEMGYGTIGTIANSIIANPAAEREGGTGVDHRFNLMFTNSGVGSEVLLYGSIQANFKERGPMGRGPKQAIVNCLTYHWNGLEATSPQNGRSWQLQIDTTLPGGTPQYYTSVGNLWIQKGSVIASAYPGERPHWTHDTSTPAAGTTLYVRGNMTRETIAATGTDAQKQWAAVDPQGSVPTQEIVATDSLATFWPTGLVALTPTGTNLRDNEVYSVIMNYAGSRPADRDAETMSLFNEISTDTGTLKTQAYVAENTPTYAQNTRTFNVPANRNTIGSSGYTLIEEYVQTFDAGVYL